HGVEMREPADAIAQNGGAGQRRLVHLRQIIDESFARRRALHARRLPPGGDALVEGTENSGPRERTGAAGADAANKESLIRVVRCPLSVRDSRRDNADHAAQLDHGRDEYRSCPYHARALRQISGRARCSRSRRLWKLIAATRVAVAVTFSTGSG